ncbi:hypothetical protein Emed_007092 [Eimeria media]
MGGVCPRLCSCCCSWCCCLPTSISAASLFPAAQTQLLLLPVLAVASSCLCHRSLQPPLGRFVMQTLAACKPQAVAHQRADGKLRVTINRVKALRAAERAANAAAAARGGSAAAAAAAAEGQTAALSSSSSFRDVTMQLCAQLEEVSPWLLRRSMRVKEALTREVSIEISSHTLLPSCRPQAAATTSSSRLPTQEDLATIKQVLFFSALPAAAAAALRLVAAAAALPPAPHAAAFHFAPPAETLLLLLLLLLPLLMLVMHLLLVSLLPEYSRCCFAVAAAAVAAPRIYLIWKPMVNLNPSPKDLEATDALNSQILQKVLDLEKEGIDEETFADVFPLTWSTTSADGEVVSLKETGGDDPVAWGERETYVSKALAFKLAEGQMQRKRQDRGKKQGETRKRQAITCALRQGLGEVVPLQVTDLLGPQQLERLVCGSPAIDLKLLKSHTRYSGYSATDKEIEWFWQALESFSTLERQQFLRFVWGRSRLPAAHAAWEQEMEVAMKAPVRPPAAAAAAAAAGAAGAAAAAGAGDAVSPRTITTPASGERVVATYTPTVNLLPQGSEDPIQQQIDRMLPQSHTCFFQVDLPPYSSYEILRSKLLYAVREGIAIDADNNADAANWDLEAD